MRLYEQQVECGAEDVQVVVAEAMQGKPPVHAAAAVCPFKGPVEVRFHRGRWDWECPSCGTAHEGDIEPD